jgi:hypothetical protein
MAALFNKLFSIFIIFAFLNYATSKTAEEIANDLAIEKSINAKFCGYNVPTINKDCFDLTTVKSQCCAITWNGKKACLPQSSTYFKDKRADFTIDNIGAMIECGTEGEKLGLTPLTKTFFNSKYCGKGFSATNVEDCMPVNSESGCCYLNSVALTSNQGSKTLKACIQETAAFRDTVVAQTLFPGSTTDLTCYNAAKQVQAKISITAKNGRFLGYTFSIVSLILSVFLM